MFGGLNLANATSGGPLGYGMSGANSAPAASGGLLGQLGQPQQLNRPMVMPSGGPNMPRPSPDAPVFDGPMPEVSGQLDLSNPIVAAWCGVPPMPTNRPSGFGGGDNPSPNSPPPPVADLFNRPLPPLGGGMAPAVPQPIDFGLGGQQMSSGNPLGGMNNWFSNFIAPRPPAMTAPAPMMPMKGMFGVR